MAFRIPTLEASPVPQAVSPNVVADSLDFGGKGQAIGQAGRVVQNVANNYLQQITDAEDDDYVATANAGLLAGEVERRMEAENNAAPGGKGFTKSYMAGFDQRAEAALKAAPSERARRRLQEKLAATRAGTHESALKFEYTAGADLRKANLEANSSRLINAAMSQPESYATFSKELNETYDLYKAEMPAQELAELKRQAQQKLAASTLGGAIDVDPSATKQQLMSGAWDDKLDPEAKARLLNASDAEIKRREEAARQRQREAEAEARAARLERQFTARLNYSDELQAAQNGESAFPEVDKQIADAYPPQEAGPMLERLRLAREEGSISKSLATVPISELGATIESLRPAGAGYANEAERQARIAEQAQAIVARRQADGAAESARAFPDIAAGFASGDPVQMAEATRKSIEVQRNVFGLPGDKVRPLSKPAASRAVEMWNLAPTTDEKLGVLNQLVTLNGEDGKPDDELGRRVLDQLEAEGLPAGADRAVEAYRAGDVGRARELITALSVDPKELRVPAGIETSDINAAVDGQVSEGAMSVAAAVAVATGQPSAVAMFNRDREVLERVTRAKIAAGVPAEKAAVAAAKIVYGEGEVIVDTDRGFAVRVPTGADADAVESGLETLRSNIALPAPPVEAGSVEARLHEQRQIDARTKGLWVNLGDGFAILDPQTQRVLPGADGKPMKFSLSDVLGAGLGHYDQQQMVAP